MDIRKECLVTKLNRVVTGDSFERLNALSLKNLKMDTDSTLCRIRLVFDDGSIVAFLKPKGGDAKFKKTSDNHIIDGNKITIIKNKNLLTQDLEITSTSEFDLDIVGKHKFRSVGYDNWEFITGVKCMESSPIDINQLNYMSDDMLQVLSGSLVFTGDISSLNKFNSFKDEGFSFIAPSLRRQLDGSGLYLKSYMHGELPEFLYTPSKLNISGHRIKVDLNKFDLSKLSKTSFNEFSIEGCQTTGDISDWEINEVIDLALNLYTSREKMKKLGYNIKGDICKVLSKIKSCNEVFANRIDGLYGNLGIIGDTVSNIVNSDGLSNFTYTKEISKQYILAIKGGQITSGLDDFLIEMSKLDPHPHQVKYPSLKTIKTKGKRTSKSDEAVKLLQEKGYTIVIEEL